MKEVEQKKIGVYVKTNIFGEITEICSDIFIKDFIGWQMIDEGNGDKYAHAQSAYFSKPLTNSYGGYNYRYENGLIVEK